jgi:hypothetical protein
MKTLEEWLEQSPLPVVGRVVDSVDDIRMLALSAAIYDENTLVLIPIKTLEQLINSIRKG